VIRTVWLGLAFLVVLAGVSSFRFAFGHFDLAYASISARAEIDSGAATNTVQETLTEADRLPPLAYTASAAEPALAPEMAKADRLPVEALPLAEPLPPAEPLPRLESLPRTPMASMKPRAGNRQWREPVSPAVRPARNQNAKRKPAKKEAVAEKPEESAEPKACQLEDYDAVRRAFSLPTGCHS
jgi:hypothetical protein